MIYPKYNQDIFSKDVILDPYPHYRAIRDLGPAVYLTATDVLSIARFEDVKAVLADDTNFLSGKGTALNAETNEMVTGTTLMSDAPRHTKMKKVLMKPLNARALQDFRERVQNAANDLIDYLVEKGEFDGVTDLAQHLPVSIISWLVGVPEDGRQNMLKWSEAGFNLIGPMNELSKQGLPITEEIVQFAQSMTNREKVTPGSWADGIFDAVDNGLIEPEMASMLIIDFMAPSLDTTIFATGWLLFLLAQNPEQWEILKQDPSLIMNAANEAIRLESPLRGFARVTATDVELSGVPIAKDTRVFILYGSANRDERKWERADEFLIQRPNLKHHLGFGFGRHICAGQHLSLLEISCILQAMIQRVDKIEASGADIKVNNNARGLSKLNVKFQ